MQMKISFEVIGKEGLDFNLKYTDTDLKTVLMVEKALMGAIGGLLANQKA